MSGGRLTIWIDGREALPVRAIPYVAGWGHSADRVAQYLAQWNELNGKPRFPNLTAYQRRGKTVAPVLPGDFDRDVWKQRALEEKLKREYPNLDGDAPNPEGASRFDDESINLLPTGVFVWLDEFASIYQREGKGGEFRLAPMRGKEVEALALEGFEDCPRRGPDADRAMIGYADFVAICHVDDPKDFGGFRVEANGLYVDLPDTDATLTPEERAAVTWHPTGQYDKPALPLPCTLGQLRAFLPDAGMAGYIDEEEVGALLSERGQARIEELPADAGSKDDAAKGGAGGTVETVLPDSGPVWWRKAREEGKRWYAEKLNDKKIGDPPIEKNHLAGHLDEWLWQKGYRNRSKHRISRSSILEQITGIVSRKKEGMGWK